MKGRGGWVACGEERVERNGKHEGRGGRDRETRTENRVLLRVLVARVCADERAEVVVLDRVFVPMFRDV